MRLTFDCNGSGEIHLDVLKTICGDTKGKSMLDLGCGFAPQTRQLGFTQKKYVDIVKRDLGEETPFFYHEDILQFLMDNITKKWDVCISLDVIEHFTSFYARAILGSMMQISDKQIIFTPLGEYILETTPSKDPDTHKSGWLPEQFEQMGWNTIVFPNFHPTLEIGAFFAYRSNNAFEYDRIKNELNKR